MENKFEDKLSKMLNEEVNVPQKITNTIKKSLEEKDKSVYVRTKLNKIAATMVGIIIIGTGVVFAGKAIIESRNSVYIAEENQYFENVYMDYVYDNTIGIKVEKYFIDQGRIGITFNIQANEEFDKIEMYSTTLTKDGTYSEEINGTTYIKWDESEVGKEYNRRFDIIRLVDENGNEVRFDEDPIGGRGAEILQYEKLDNNKMRILYQTPVYQEITTNRMKVVIKRIVTYKEENKKEYIGNWEFEINIADKYLSQSNTIEYHGKVNLQNVIVEKATLSATKLIVTIKADDLNKLLNGTDNKPVYGAPKLLGEKEEYDSVNLNIEQSNYYDKNESVFKFDISKFSAEDTYQIVFDGGMIVTLTKDN